MEFNRNQVFAAGIFFLLLGLQFRMVEEFVLTPQFTRLVAEMFNHPLALADATVETLAGSSPPTVPPKSIRPPEWIGYAFLSVGAVLFLQSLTMKKPG